MFRKSFNSDKCKTSLGLTVARIKVMRNQRQATIKVLRRETSQLLETGQDKISRIQVEHVIKEEKTLFAYDLLEVYCKQIMESLTIIKSKKQCPINLKEAIAGVIFASQRCPELTELSDVRKRLEAKYGREFVLAALELRPSCGVGSVIAEKLSVKTPDIETKLCTLTAIAIEHGINWEPKSCEEQLEKTSDGIVNDHNSFPCTSGSKPTKWESPTQTSHYDAYTIKPLEKKVQSPARHSPSCLYDSSVPTDQQTEPQTSGMDDSLKLGKQNIEFRDASRATADTAERVNLASEAAAEFPKRETSFRQSGSTADETSYMVQELASKSQLNKVDLDFGKNIPDDSRKKDKERDDFGGTRIPSNMTKFPSPSSDTNNQDSTFLSNRSSRSIKQVVKHVEADGNMALRNLSVKHTEAMEKLGRDRSTHSRSSSSTSIDSEMNNPQFSSMIGRSSQKHKPEERHDQKKLGIDDCHYDRVEKDGKKKGKEQFCGSSSSPYIKECTDADGLLLDDQCRLMFAEVATRNIEGIGTESTTTKSQPEIIKCSSSKRSSSTSCGQMHSELQKTKDSSHTVTFCYETDDQIGNLQGTSNSPTNFDDYGTDDREHVNAFHHSDNSIEDLDLLNSKSIDFSLHQDSWPFMNNENELPIEYTAQTGYPEGVMKHSLPNPDETLSPKFDEIDDDYTDCDHDVLILGYNKEGMSTDNVLSYPGRESTVNVYSTPENHNVLDLHFDNFPGGFRNKGLLCPPYIKSSTECDLSSTGRVDVTSFMEVHLSSKEKHNFENTRLSGQNLGEWKSEVESSSHNGNKVSPQSFTHQSHMVDGFSLSYREESSRKTPPTKEKYVESSRSKTLKHGEPSCMEPLQRLHGDPCNEAIVRNPAHSFVKSDRRCHSSILISNELEDEKAATVERVPYPKELEYSSDEDEKAATVERVPCGKTLYNNVDLRYKSFIWHSSFDSSEEHYQPHGSSLRQGTTGGIQSYSTEESSFVSTKDPNLSSDYPNNELLVKSNLPESKIQNKLSQSRSYDLRSRWNNKYNHQNC